MPHTPAPWTVQGNSIHHLMFEEPLDGRNQGRPCEAARNAIAKAKGEKTL